MNKSLPRRCIACRSPFDSSNLESKICHSCKVALERMKDYAAPVVRCKDCVRYNTKGCADGFGWCEGYDRGMMDYDFCSHGAKRDLED